MGKKDDEEMNLEKIETRLDMLDDRLDNIDSTVSAVVERVMNQACYIHATCPHCQKDFEIALIGLRKPKV